MEESSDSSNIDVETLQKLILEMAVTITGFTNDHYLKGLVGSCFDTMNAQTILDELKAYNEGFRPLWLEPN